MLVTSFCLGLWIQSSFLIRHGTIIDGTGSKPYKADVRIVGNKISQIGKLKWQKGDRVIDATGMYITPGFIDAHSHADTAMDKLESQIRQGITTAIVGQDGFNPIPIPEFFKELEKKPELINFATFSGHGTVREEVMGKDFERLASPAEIEKMAKLVEKDMKAGAIGLSTGLEYDPGHYSNTEELISLTKVAAQYGGMYISHVRDEGNGALKSFDELLDIARATGAPAQISHIKLATAMVWNQSQTVLNKIQSARQEGLRISADVYPYTFWQSTITALTISRDWSNPKVWQQALDEVGGAQNIRLTKYRPNPKWEGKSLDQVAKLAKKSPADTIVEIVQATKGKDGSESILCQAMNPSDLEKFIASGNVMICSDGTGGGSHPRSAGAFPRVFSEFVKKKPILTWQQAVNKMTLMPAYRFRLNQERGRIQSGYVADIVIFDPKTIKDRATPDHPTTFATGVRDVFVSGAPALLNNKLTKNRTGKGLRPFST